MEVKYLKAVKAGLICAVVIIILRTVINIVFYWTASKQSVQQWVNDQTANPTPYSTSMPALPPDVILAGIAICGGGLLIFALYMFAGILAAWYTAKISAGAVDLLLLGAIAGAIAHTVSAPFQYITMFIMNLISGGTEMFFADLGKWLIDALGYNFGPMLIVAVILAAVSALISGAMIKAFGRKNKA